MDVLSEKGKFGWHTIGAHLLPYIFRVVNDEHLKFVSVRMAENYLLGDYIHFLNVDIYSICTSVEGHLITKREAKHLNFINKKHCDQLYGNEDFVADIDYIAHLDDVYEFYLFIEFCFKRLTNTYTPGNVKICGFIRIESTSVLPYCVINNKEYIPFFFFEEEPGDIWPPTIELKSWKLAYLKFCCIVQGIQQDLFKSNSCLVISLDDIKRYFEPHAHFEDFWPPEIIDKDLLSLPAFGNFNPPGCWIIKPHNIGLTKESIVQHSYVAASLTDVPSSSMPMGINSNQSRRLSNQLVHLNTTRAPLPTQHSNVSSRKKIAVAQYNNKKSATFKPSRRNNPMNAQRRSLVQFGVPSVPTTQIDCNPVANPNIASTNKSINILPNLVPNDNVVSSQHERIVQQYFLNSGQVQRPQQQQRQQSQVQTTMASERAVRISSTQPQNLIPTNPSDIIDLSLSPSSPGPSAALPPELSFSLYALKYQRIPAFVLPPGSSRFNAYKVTLRPLQSKMIYCINHTPFNSDSVNMLVTLDDLIQTVFPTVSMDTCANILAIRLKVTLYKGNPDQLVVLRMNNRFSLINGVDPFMAKLNDIMNVFLQLKNLVNNPDKQTQQYNQTDG